MARRRLENPRERLQAAALDLFAQQGLDGTTVAEIAAKADVSERTFFRYFGDKREVIFFGQERLEQQITADLDAAQTDDVASLVSQALDSAATFFPTTRRAQSLRRRAVLDSDPSLRERELAKLASLADAVTSGLERHGVDPSLAALAAQTTVSVFGVAHAQWLTDEQCRPMRDIQHGLLASLNAALA